MRVMRTFILVKSWVTFLNHAEIHLDYKAYALLRLIAYTGMRKSEALALTWNDLNLVDNELTINKAIGRGKNTQLYLKSTKTGKARTIKIDETTVSILKEWKKLQKQKYFKLGINTLQKSQLIFSNKHNAFIQPGQVQKWMYSVQNKFALKKVSPHGLIALFYLKLVRVLKKYKIAWDIQMLKQH